MPSLLKWLIDRSGTFSPSIAYSYNSTGERFYYYQPPLTASAIHSFLRTTVTPFRASSILAINSQTYQNSIHYIAAGNLYPNDATIENEFCLDSNLLTATTYHQLHFPEMKKTDETITGDILATYVSNHLSLKAKTIKETITQETQTTLQFLLNYIGNHEKQLQLLTAKDLDFNTILLSAFSGHLPYEAFAPMMHFVQAYKNLAHFNFTQFALARNTLGSTIFHYMTSKVGGFCAEIFGQGILQEAFISKDQLGFTPLHYVCESNTPHKLADIKLICNLLAAATISQNSPLLRIPIGNFRIENRLYHEPAALTIVFDGSDKGGYTPCHLVCICARETDIPVIEYFRANFPALLKEQLLRPDQLGNLPSHYAIKSGNVPFVKSLFANLKQDEQVFLLMTTNLDSATGFDYALMFSDAAMLEYIIGILGPDNLYNYCKAKPTLTTYAKDNSKLADKLPEMLNRYKILYDCTDYFLGQQTQYVNNDPTYLMRLNDFRMCIEIIKQKSAYLPPLLPAIQYDTSWWFFQAVSEYYEYRKFIRTTMQDQLIACKSYFHNQANDNVSKNIVTSLFGSVKPEHRPLLIKPCI